MIKNNIPTWHSIPDSIIAEVQALNPMSMAEVGVWLGYSSAIWLQNTNTHLYAIDTWLGALEFIGASDMKRDLQLKDGYPQVYYSFLQNMRDLGLEDRITVIPNTSRIAAQYLSRQHKVFDCIYLDGSHEYEDVRDDIQSYLPLVRAGGLLFGDDYADEWKGVQRAVHEMGVTKIIGRYWMKYV
jgi:hypothetical protein